MGGLLACGTVKAGPRYENKFIGWQILMLAMHLLNPLRARPSLLGVTFHANGYGVACYR